MQFGENTALEKISFDIQKGEYIGLVGPNGAGKSTLLKIILGILSPTSGSITKEEKIVFGYVPQHYLLHTSFSISVQEVLEMGNIFSFWKRKKKQHSAQEVLSMVGLDQNFATKNFQDLSGGQKQRVIIARSLIKNPSVLLFDEPLSGVDFTTKVQIYELLKEVNTKYKTTIIFVSHEIESIIARCDRVLCLNTKLHEGCHPVEFAKGNLESCTVLQAGQVARPIHHHHSIAQK